MSEVKVNKISPRTNCGTVTLGDSGDTFTIPSGVTITNNGTQTGFGRTGTVNWDTTAKTADFTAVSGNGYFVNTTSGAITVTLPSSPSAGDIVSIADYTNTFQTNKVTIARNGSKIGGESANASLSTEGQSVTLIYVDATEGWKNVQDSTSNVTGETFLTATGGTITTSGDYKIHTFTGPGTFCVSSLGNTPTGNRTEYLVVAGGGGGGSKSGCANEAGGGGGGGFRESDGTVTGGCYTASPLKAACGALTVTATGYPIVIGAGGSSSSNGVNSSYSTITSAGGGAGGDTGGDAGNPGGSGGGGGYGPHGASGGGAGGTGNTPPVSPPQGNNGGTQGSAGGSYPTGGGGGATAVGGNGGPPSCGPAGSGGAGATSSINGTPTTRAGGGGGSVYNAPAPIRGAGGSGGGGAGASSGPSDSTNAGAGTMNVGMGQQCLESGAHGNNNVAMGWSAGEDLTGENQLEHWIELLIFLQLPVDQSNVASILSTYNFEYWSKGRKKGEEDQSSHMRKGISGDWKNYFTPKVEDYFKSIKNF